MDVMRLFLSLFLLLSCSPEQDKLSSIQSIDLLYQMPEGKRITLHFTRVPSKEDSDVYLNKEEMKNLKDRLNQQNFLAWKDRDVEWQNLPHFLRIQIFDGQSYTIKELNDHNKEHFNAVYLIFKSYLEKTDS